MAEWLRGFRDFVRRGNFVELAVAVAVGVAFTGLVAAFGNSFIKPLVNVVLGGGAKGGTFTIRGQVFDVGGFVNALLVFAITVAVVYFLVVLPMNTLMARWRGKDSDEPAPPTDVEVLLEIRDLLREQRTTGSG
ncbi:MAG TPA: MscL family protein [Actinomycetes bacterium]|nr:MscL family protein [Actinomycetes bacterium]